MNQSVHAEILSPNLLVRQEYLYNMESHFDEFLPAKIFAVSSYPGHVPTFQALVEDKFIFSYLPVNAFASKEVEPMSLADANYFNCPSEVFSMDDFEYLKDCQVFNKDGSWLGLGKVIMTLDWHQDNQLCHMVHLDSGNFVLRPSHKVVFYNPDDVSTGRLVLPKFLKLRHEWKV